MTQTHTPRRRALLALAALATSALIAACGSSSSSSTSSSTAAASASSGSGTNRAALMVCLRKHGITLPAGAGAPGGGAPAARAAVRWVRRSRRRLAPGRFPAGANGGKAPSRIQGLWRELPSAPKRRGSSAPDDSEVRHVRAPARLQAAQSELLRQRPGVPRQHPLQRQVPVGQPRLPEPAGTGGSARTNGSLDATVGCSRSLRIA